MSGALGRLLSVRVDPKKNQDSPNTLSKMSKLAKTGLRKAIKSKILQLGDSEFASQSQNVFKSVIDHQDFRKARSVGLFMSMPRSEVNTNLIIEHCFQKKKSVYLPKCLQSTELKNSMTFLKLNNFSDVMELQPSGKYNLREPSTGVDVMDCGDLDLIIVPGVAFTPAGHRLGHGAGYYDRFLEKYKAKFHRVPYLMGVCLSQQLVNDLPTEQHDWVMDHVVLGDSSE